MSECREIKDTPKGHGGGPVFRCGVEDHWGRTWVCEKCLTARAEKAEDERDEALKIISNLNLSDIEEENKELKVEVERLNGLIKHIYHYGSMLRREDHEAMMNWASQTGGERAIEEGKHEST